ncbi:type I glyceraldehyde-3-phosphate dehydrogenase [Neptuniibacter sp. 1_MG-2023]|uniref:type I glyceraldehyde-3-phosphate dehydrogenase n=1 Tax=Neptuniibacter sp. 1_MG-2023 TaxID=3062662 RepID=UPI0026E21136|nr:glyceraldehyde 3-phosphate dehydrogenase NAD-binding domain-containing protein [Neptuniibacter sp. 1_MG-2023]MDO6594216.1 glyceraldehyde 3-phosphate dehydrogenase NAD-binding domain-containing protein [Neptuniibacter sp. 1_MG-2023]
MNYRVAINGYGRIGQCVLRAIYENGLQNIFKVVVINELSDIETVTYLTRYDTTHGRFPASVEHDGKKLIINGDKIDVINESEVKNLPWSELDIDLIFECSGSFKSRAVADKHIEQGAKRLLFSQPATTDVDATIVYGLNEQLLKAEHQIVSAASCTTNCIIPVLDLLDRELGIQNGVTTTIHSAMNDQPVIDSYHQTDLRLTRSAMHSIVPVDTGLDKGIDRLLPHLEGKFQCLHIRVPTINVSMMDMSINVDKETSVEVVNQILRQASMQGALKGLLGYTEEPHASVDFNRDARSAVVDGTQTKVSEGHLVKVVCWFDNEWGFANRMLDVAKHWLQLA